MSVMRIKLPGREWIETAPAASVTFGPALDHDAVQTDPSDPRRLLIDWAAIELAIVEHQRIEFRALMRRIDPVYR